jgi:hypothetical protein
VSTYTGINATCLDECAFKKSGCYVRAGWTHILATKLDDEAAQAKATALDVIKNEAALIDAAFPEGVPRDGARGGRDLRLHVSGDAPTTECAKVLASAARRWKARGGGTVFTYTHSWRHIKRSAWGPISVLASIEHPRQAAEARKQGYAASLVVEKFPSRRAFEVDGETFIPCPAQNVDANGEHVTCVECRLCLDRDLLALGKGIAFEVHGSRKPSAIRALVQLRTPTGAVRS